MTKHVCAFATLTHENVEPLIKMMEFYNDINFSVKKERKLPGLRNTSQPSGARREQMREKKGCCQICQRQTWHVRQNCHSAVFRAAQEHWIHGKPRECGREG